MYFNENTSCRIDMRKKIWIYLLTGAVLVAAAGCGSSPAGKNKDALPTPINTTAPTEESTPSPQTTPTTAPTQSPEATSTTVPQETPVPEETVAPTQGADAEPKLILGEYIGLELTNITQQEVEEEIKLLLEDFVEYVETDRAAVNGDIVNINYAGTLNGVAFEGGTDDSEEGTDLILGSGMFIDGFEEGLVGAVAGEVRELNLTFPQEYKNNTELAGQPVVFTVTVNSVMEEVIPELTDEFVSENLYADTTAEEFRQIAYDSLNEEYLFAQVVEQLLAATEFISYPEDELQAVIDYQMDYYNSYADYYASMLGSDRETMLQYVFNFESEAQMEAYVYDYSLYMIETELVIEAIAREESIEVTDAAYEERGLLYAYQNGYSDMESFEAYYGEEEIKGAILYDLVIEYIMSKATIIDAE